MFKKILITFALSFFLLSCAKREPIPNLTLNTLNNEPVALQSYKGKTLLIDFWATWCPPCRESFPWMNEMQQKYKNQGLEIVAISLDHDEKAVAKFVKKIPPNFTVLLDPTSISARHFNVIGMPMSFLFNAKGELVEQHAGFSLQKTDLYEEKIINALAKK